MEFFKAGRRAIRAWCRGPKWYIPVRILASLVSVLRKVFIEVFSLGNRLLKSDVTLSNSATAELKSFSIKSGLSFVFSSG